MINWYLRGLAAARDRDSSTTRGSGAMPRDREARRRAVVGAVNSASGRARRRERLIYQFLGTSVGSQWEGGHAAGGGRVLEAF